MDFILLARYVGRRMAIIWGSIKGVLVKVLLENKRTFDLL